MPVVLNELLGRPLLKIYQDTDCFNFSLDSILLANFVTIPKNTKMIVDLGTGNAPIPLYLSLRTKSLIYGVEIQKYSYELALKSVKINLKEEQIKLINQDLKGVSQSLGLHKANVVVSNPPFFKLGEAHQNPDMRKNIARHEIMASLDDIVKEAAALLNSNGIFAMVHRPDRLVEIIEALRRYNLEPKRIRLVYPHLGDKANHLLIEAVRDGKPGGLKVEPPLIVYGADSKWTEEVIKIYNCEED